MLTVRELIKSLNFYDIPAEHVEVRIDELKEGDPNETPLGGIDIAVPIVQNETLYTLRKKKELCQIRCEIVDDCLIYTPKDGKIFVTITIRDFRKDVHFENEIRYTRRTTLFLGEKASGKAWVADGY